MKRAFLFLPLFVILAVCTLLLIGLQQDPKKIASALIGKPVPEFYQTDLLKIERVLSNKDLPKQAFLLNVWGSWCAYCKQEHPFLMQLSKSIPIVGLNYRDKTSNALAMLQKIGNPFVLVINDSKGEFALNLGVDGAPETYLVDKYGVVQYRYTGPLNAEIWQNYFVPELQHLETK
ncbi:periplasmic protein thiol:disulfide oxidoreductases DsbE [Pasteurella multocida]|nr:periplasmic protein thiol:disulfide oxidoreductases DsbE [Pasteurella multocida]